MTDHSYEQQLAELKKEYLELLPKELKDIKAAWEHIQHVNWDPKKLAELKLASHRLVGSGASYGFANISTAAKLLEEQLRQIESEAGSEDRKLINQHLEKLTEAVSAACQSKIEAPRGVAKSTTKSGSEESKAVSIAVIEDDPDQAEFLKLNLQQFGYNVFVFESPTNFANDKNNTSIELIILDVSFPEGPLEGLFWLEQIHNQLNTHCPIIIISARSDFVARMRAVRAGASAYISKPLDLESVNTQIQNCLSIHRSSPTRILWVDDDAQLLALYKRVLTAQGFEFKGITQPLKLIESLEEFAPDIVLMDYQMPGCNGAELATMLKQDVRFMTIPIIFASGSNSAIAQKEQLGILGNSFLKKPFETEALLATIQTQLRKAKFVSGKIKQVSQRLDKDSLQTKPFFLEKLEALLIQDNLSKDDEKAFLVYATVDNIDYLQERFGLRKLSNIHSQLEHFLSAHPLIMGNGCTIGNTSFLLLMTFKKTVVESDALYKFLQTVETRSYSVDGKRCQLTLTMGAMLLQSHHQLDDVISSVEQACYDGMAAGGNRVEWVKQDEQTQDLPNTAIKSLLEKQAFKLYFQPIVNIETDEAIFESLIRLQDEEGRTFAPKQFMPWIDKTLEGGTNTLDRWLIRQAITELKEISNNHGKGASLVIKLASSLSQIVGLLPELGFAFPKNTAKTDAKLIFALPVSVIIKDAEKAKQIIESLNELGCGFMIEKVEAVDAHLKLLKELGPVSYVKVLPHQKVSKTMDKFITHIQAELTPKPTVVVSEVEDSVMLAHYWELGVRNFQGYFIQKPGEQISYAGETETHA